MPDAVRLLHFAVVVFVIGGLALVVIGNRRGWHFAGCGGGHFEAEWRTAAAALALTACFGGKTPATLQTYPKGSDVAQQVLVGRAAAGMQSRGSKGWFTATT